MHSKLTKKEKKVLDFLKKNPFATHVEVSRHMGSKTRSIGQYYINQLIIKGYIARNHEQSTKYNIN